MVTLWKIREMRRKEARDKDKMIIKQLRMAQNQAKEVIKQLESYVWLEHENAEWWSWFLHHEHHQHQHQQCGQRQQHGGHAGGCIETLDL